MDIEQINTLPTADAEALFRQCCCANAWVVAMAAARPFADPGEMIVSADRIWTGLGHLEYLQAFEGHPKIGDVDSLRAKFANTKALASSEQSGVAGCDESVLQGLADGNDQYLQKFGFIFIVCATGKSAVQMLALLQQRLPNSRDKEILIAAEEQRKITTLRLERLL